MRHDSPDPGRAGGTHDGVPLRGTAVVAVGLLVAQILAMLQMLVVSRLLGPAEFGAFGALAVILLLGSTTMVATQVVVARHVASGRPAAHVTRRDVLIAGAATAALTLVLGPVLNQLLHLSGWVAVTLVAATFVPYTITGAQLGLLQGAEQHARLGVLYALSTALRVLGAMAGAGVGRTTESALLGLAVGALLASVAGRWLILATPAQGTSDEAPRAFLAEVVHAAHALVALYALTNIDVLLARAQLSAHDAGLYAAGALVARAVFFLPSAVLVAAFPRMAAGSRGAQRQAVWAIGALGLAATLGVALLPEVAIGIMAGSQYLEVAGSAWIFALAGAGFSVVQVLLYARMAHRDRRAALLLWSGVAALVALGITVGTTIPGLVSCAAGVAWSVAAAGIVWARASSQRGELDPVPGQATP